MEWNEGPAAWLSLPLAFAALVQPWFIFVWRRFWPGKIFMERSGLCELCFANWGPTLAFRGTFRTQRSSQFVRRLVLRVVRASDNATRNFEWDTFRKAGEKDAVEGAASFVLQAGDTRTLTTTFIDRSVQTDATQVCESVQAKWNEATKPLFAGARPHTESAQEKEQRATQLKHTFESFRASEPCVQAYGKLTRQLFWEPGKFVVAVLVETDRGVQSAEKWSFALTDQDCEILRLNCATVVDFACDMQVFPWRFVFKSMSSDSATAVASTKP